MSDLQKLLRMLFLKSAPQDLRYSTTLVIRMVLFYFASGIFVLHTTFNPPNLVAGLLLGFILQFIFVYGVLSSLQHKARFAQTFSAIMGVAVLFNLLAWPVFGILADIKSDESQQASASLIFLLIMSWEVLVKAHIFKNALEMRMISSLALSFSMLFIVVAITQMVLPEQAAG